MECLPSDVVLDILSRLPVASVLDCKFVCKRFLDLISHPRNQFTKIHHQRQLPGLLFCFGEKIKPGCYKARFCYGHEYNSEMNIYGSLSYNTLPDTSNISFSPRDHVIGSCNGLICLNRYHRGNIHIHIYNPITGEYVNLPHGDTFCEQNHFPFFGFGYVHSMTSEQYKVVKICYPNNRDDFSKGEVQVYTIGSGSGWRAIGATSHLSRTSLTGIFANGALYWNNDRKIVAFNLADEGFGLVESPPCFKNDTSAWHDYMVRALRGNLCICHHRKEENLLDIWSLKQNATGTSWSMDFSIAYDSSDGGMYHKYPPPRPLLITKKNEVIFVHQWSTLYCYDPKANTVIQLWDVDVVNGELCNIEAFPHVNSFVSLEALAERCESIKKLSEKGLEDTD